ncbi:unnamed protein product [Closterium sp. NIES-53]
MAGLIGFAGGTVATAEDPDLRAEFRAMQLLTFTVISPCCSPSMQIALKSCREYPDAGHRVWHFIELTYQGIPSSYNQLKRLSMAPSTRATLNEDTMTSYIVQDEVMREAERSNELLAQVNYDAPAKQGGRSGQRGQSGNGGSSGWKSPRMPIRRSPPRKAVVEEEVNVGTPTTSPSSALTAARKQVLIPDLLYVPGVRANLLSAGQLKENGVMLQEDGDGMLLVSGDVHRACPLYGPASVLDEVDVAYDGGRGPGDDCLGNKVDAGQDACEALRTSAWTPSRARQSTRKLARHTFPDQGSDADNVLAVVHIYLCGPFQVAAKDCSLYFLLLKDHKTRYMWMRPVAKKLNALQEFVQWLAVAERQTKKLVLMLRSDQGGGGEFLRMQFTDFVNEKGIVHDLTYPYTPQQNGITEREIRTVVELVRTMLLHIGVQHH